MPSAKVVAREIPDLPNVTVSAQSLQRGASLFLERCSWCHGYDAVGTGSIADLRYASAATHSSWNAIVLEGAYFEKGMPGFGEILSEEDAQAIHAYVVQQARIAFESVNQ